MKIAILTQPLRFNFGGILQNYALQTVLLRMGHEVVTLDPRRNQFSWWEYPLFTLRHIAARYLKGYKDANLFAEYNKDKEIRKIGVNTFKFIDKYISRKTFTNLSNEMTSKDCDAIVVGSDQVWRPKYNRNLSNMYLDFTSGWHIKRIAYAASFGTDEIEYTDEQIDECRKLLSVFDAVSVREKSGITLCKEVFGVDAVHVLDPTLLLDAADYMMLVDAYPPAGVSGNLYYYILDNSEENAKLIQDYAKEKGLKPFTCNSKAADHHNKHTVEEKIQLPVEHWLQGFNQAEYVITDSFHACVFSILFKKQFFVYANAERGLARYKSLFNMLGIEDRFVNKVDDIYEIGDIDYNIVYEKLDSLRTNSLVFLRNSLILNKR